MNTITNLVLHVWDIVACGPLEQFRTLPSTAIEKKNRAVDISVKTTIFRIYFFLALLLIPSNVYGSHSWRGILFLLRSNNSYSYIIHFLESVPFHFFFIKKLPFSLFPFNVIYLLASSSFPFQFRGSSLVFCGSHVARLCGAPGQIEGWKKKKRVPRKFGIDYEGIGKNGAMFK